jgi:hypothetical protein
MTPKHLPGPPMTLGNMTSADYRQLADEEVTLAKAAVTNVSRAQHYAMAAYYTRLAEANERLPITTEVMTRDASSNA